MNFNIDEIKAEIRDIKNRLSVISNKLKEKNIGKQNIDELNIVIKNLSHLSETIC